MGDWDTATALKGLIRKPTCFKLQHEDSNLRSAWVIYGEIKLTNFRASARGGRDQWELSQRTKQLEGAICILLYSPSIWLATNLSLFINLTLFAPPLHSTDFLPCPTQLTGPGWSSWAAPDWSHTDFGSHCSLSQAKMRRRRNMFQKKNRALPPPKKKN